MNLYDRYILPRLIDLAMRQREVARYRAKIVPRARGAVVEIGVGSGLNLPFYGPQVAQLTAIDPSRELLAMARRNARLANFDVELLENGQAGSAVLTRAWKRLSGGCNLDRRIDALLEAAGFEIVELESAYAKGPKAWSYVYAGAAVPA